MPNDDEYAREVISTVKELTREMVETRQQITRATLPLYPRIVEVERQLAAEQSERPKRQRELDGKLEAQNVMLAMIFRWQFWGRVFDVVLALALVVFAIIWWVR